MIENIVLMIVQMINLYRIIYVLIIVIWNNNMLIQYVKIDNVVIHVNMKIRIVIGNVLVNAQEIII